jgi:hypothetical protein
LKTTVECSVPDSLKWPRRCRFMHERHLKWMMAGVCRRE